MLGRIAAVSILTAGLGLTSPVMAADPISGRCVTEDKDAVAAIGDCGASTCGTIARFLITPPDGLDQRDINNPDRNLRTRKLLGLPILTGFKKDDDLWRGRIYDPNTGKSYRSVVRRKDANTLEVKGCIGPFCQTQIWRKAR